MVAGSFNNEEHRVAGSILIYIRRMIEWEGVFEASIVSSRC